MTLAQIGGSPAVAAQAERRGSEAGGGAVKMSGPDVLFPLRNNFYLGAFQAAINESTVRNLSDADAVEKDSFVYRSYIALGQYQVSAVAVASPLLCGRGSEVAPVFNSGVSCESVHACSRF